MRQNRLDSTFGTCVVTRRTGMAAWKRRLALYAGNRTSAARVGPAEAEPGKVFRREGGPGSVGDEATPGAVSARRVWSTWSTIVLVTPAMLRRLPAEGIADKELSAPLRRERLVPVVHGTTYEELEQVSLLLASRAVPDGLVPVTHSIGFRWDGPVASRRAPPRAAPPPRRMSETVVQFGSGPRGRFLDGTQCLEVAPFRRLSAVDRSSFSMTRRAFIQRRCALPASARGAAGRRAR